MTLRVLMLTEFFPRTETGEITGGVEARCYYVSKHLRAEHHVEVVAQRTDGRQWEFASFRSLPRRIVFLVTSFVRALTAPADVIEGSNLVVYPAAWLAAVFRRRPLVFYYPDVLLGSWRERFGAIGWIGEVAERIVLRMPVDRYITTAEVVAAKMRRAGVPGDRIALVPCGFEEAAVDRVTAELSADGTPSDAGGRQKDYDVQDHDIVVVSRLVGYKRVDVVLRAAARVAMKRGSVRVLVLGRGPEQERLEKLAADLGIADAVTFAGYVPAHDDVLRRMARGRVFVTASEVEGFGIVLAEAMALGVPYVASDIAVFREVTGEGTGGMIFPAGDDEALAERLGQLLDDPELRRRLGGEGRAFAERYRWGEIAAATAQVYEDAIDHRRSRRARR